MYTAAFDPRQCADCRFWCMTKHEMHEHVKTQHVDPSLVHFLLQLSRRTPFVVKTKISGTKVVVYKTNQ